jgi:hypothetical protein
LLIFLFVITSNTMLFSCPKQSKHHAIIELQICSHTKAFYPYAVVFCHSVSQWQFDTFLLTALLKLRPM